jgi:CRP-like cAMP-binding protein/Pyruvate/2-oxoacid:ferredoxin oxidoreductase delta subunit
MLGKNDILKIPLFSGVEHTELSPLLNDCDINEFKSGQYIYRAGDYGEDCCILLSGAAKIDLPRKKNFQPELVFEQGDIVGEIAALSRYTRIADVRALKRSRVLVIPRKTLLKLIDEFSHVKDHLDKIYTQRVLSNQLLTIPIFAGIPDEALEDLKNNITLHSYRKGDVIFSQGDEADAFYLVRYGFIKVTELGDDGIERVLAYLKGGHYFGEMALLEEGKKRMATVTAISRSELIKISREDFLDILETYPRMKSTMMKAVEKRKERNIRIHEDKNIEMTLSAVIDSGVIQARGILVIDTTKCIQCDNCVRACAAKHHDYSRLKRRGVRLSNILMVVTSCRHCDDPTCMIDCSTGAIARDFTGEIYYRDYCIGCGKCAKKCPYGNITIIDISGNARGKRIAEWLGIKGDVNGEKEETRKRPLRKAVKCDMCRDFSFIACVYNCPTGAARKVDPTDFFTDITTIG